MPEFEVIVYPGGRTTIHVRGEKGKGCVDLVKGIERALVDDPAKVKRTHTAEYDEAPVKTPARVGT